jgi:hypothetical protein
MKMTRTVIQGLNGSNPLGFMASVGLLRLLQQRSTYVRLGFVEDGTSRAWVETDSRTDLISAVLDDVLAAAGPQPWRLEYDKVEKNGIKRVADLKAPPEKFAEFLASTIAEWRAGRPEGVQYAASFGTDVAVDSKGNTKPTALHFTAANQQFLGIVEEIRKMITREWIEDSLEDRHEKARSGSNLRWDPDSERSRALMGTNPNDDGTVVNAPLEWLAFRALPALRCMPIGNRIATCGVAGRRQNELRLHWPLWSVGASYAVVCSAITTCARWAEEEDAIKTSIDVARAGKAQPKLLRSLQMDLARAVAARRSLGVFAICTAEIRRTTQGFGNFGPASVRA